MTSSTGIYNKLTQFRGGQIIQTVTTVMHDPHTQSVGAAAVWDLTHFPISIALSKASNLVLVTGFVSIGGQLSTHVGIRRAGSNVTSAIAINTGNKVAAHSGAGGGGNDSHACCSCPIHFVDQPNSTAMLRYYLQFAHTSGSTQTIYLNRSSNDGNGTERGRYVSVLTAQEIQT